MSAASQNDLYKAGLKSYRLPSFSSLLQGKTLAFLLSSTLLVLFGSAARGEFFLFFTLLWKNWDQFKFFPYSSLPEDKYSSSNESLSSLNQPVENTTLFNSSGSENVSKSFLDAVDEFLKPYHFQQFYIHVCAGLSVSYAMFLLVGGFLQWQYYIKQRDQPEKWKCQPNRFLSAENERHEFLLGVSCLLVAGSISGLVTTYVVNGGPRSKVYYNIDDYGWTYFFVSTICMFMMQDAGSYYYHRMLHWPIFYTRFHKWHHRYHSPTAFSAVAMHPVESTFFQLILIGPIFIIPLHFVSLVGCFHYLYYYGLIDHSGVDMDSIWPWQPPVRFHDDHHRYFHVNFGFNTMIFDRFHGTLRRKDRRYGEDIFYGKGAAPDKKSE